MNTEKPELKDLIHRLATVEPSESSPLISCFVHLEHPTGNAMRDMANRAEMLRGRLPYEMRRDFDDALGEIHDYLANSIESASRSVALYSRWGDMPFFAAEQFRVPLKTQFVVDQLPHIYPLIELKDTYDRFVLVITTQREARILETTIGSVTREILKNRTELRKRFGREWTVERYQNHKHEREMRFVREKVEIIEKLMSQRGHNHLVVAGSVKMANQLVKALPPHLRERVITTLPTNPKSGIDPILAESLEQFTRVENDESLSMVDRLESAYLTGGLAAIGYDDVKRHLEAKRVDALIVDQDFTDTDRREELVRLAAAQNVGVETVRASETLARLGGIGCLLRYSP